MKNRKSMFKRFFNWLSSCKVSRESANKEYYKRQLQDYAQEIYQICEYGGCVWFTFKGNLVCPMSFMAKEDIEALKEMRDLYVERKMNYDQ